MNIVRSTARKAIRSKAWKSVSRYIRNLPDGAKIEEEHSEEFPQGKVLVYFGDTAAKTYQLIQWIPVFEALNEKMPVVILLRRPSAVLRMEEHTTLPIVLKRRFRPMMDYLHEHSFRLVFYVNNGLTNFQAMGYGQAVHVHVNHGESDKVSMVSNQAKAYDKIFVAGEAAIARHHKALLDFDFDKLVKVGRPQLDFVSPYPLSPTAKKTVMYAPTWEGENEANNYTSVDLYGPAIVEAILGLDGVRLIYKPHPRVEKSHDPEMVEANSRIHSLIEEANSNGGENEILMQGDILGMFDDVDLMITDVSSVGLDFLYLHPERPLILTDRRSNAYVLAADAPISKATPVISSENVSSVSEVLSTALESDPNHSSRTRLRAFYFGNGKVGDSSQLFFDEVRALIADRETKLSELNVASGEPAEPADEER